MGGIIIKKILNIVLLLLLIGTLSISFADTGSYVDRGKVIVNESGDNVTYNALCIEPGKGVDAFRDKLNTSSNVTVREGTIEYIVNSWNSTTNDDMITFYNFQQGLDRISNNSSLPYVTYPDFYKVLKNSQYNSTVTEEMINGTLYQVTRWSALIDEFIFRIMGDGFGPDMTDRQDSIIFLFNTYLTEGVDYVEIIIPPNNTENNSSNNSPNNNNSNTINSTPDNETIKPNSPQTNIKNNSNDMDSNSHNNESNSSLELNIFAKMKPSGINYMPAFISILEIFGFLGVIRLLKTKK